ncbi:hypothetical protein Lbys_2894 [Leadbetterella byssophila DSM 17132]|uniref:Uncharacterized protein n=1 Tax=Leadbetterella byssophila (strain DSM 17132 / JCM 16389 / KACC 11308 / NBRC 106382 / 4M15) TaxID=649349 RepID=E4RSI6_LEAB4|nr:hypothetical protein Lbys_2894 [Leadbetterella byssophila DSM 17132]
MDIKSEGFKKALPNYADIFDFLLKMLKVSLNFAE